MADPTTVPERPPLDLPAVLKECAFIALVMFGLGVGMVAFYTRDVPGGLVIDTRWIDTFIVTGIGFFGRLAMVLMREERPLPALVIVAPAALAMLVLVICLLYTSPSPRD